MPSEPTDIASGLALCRKATPGEWFSVQVADKWMLLDGPNYGDRELTSEASPYEEYTPGVGVGKAEANCTLAAYAGTYLESILLELESARREQDWLRLVARAFTARVLCVRGDGKTVFTGWGSIQCDASGVPIRSESFLEAALRGALGDTL